MTVFKLYCSTKIVSLKLKCLFGIALFTSVFILLFLYRNAQIKQVVQITRNVSVYNLTIISQMFPCLFTVVLTVVQS